MAATKKPRRKLQNNPPAKGRRIEITNSAERTIDFPATPGSGTSYVTIEVKDNRTSRVFIHLDGIPTDLVLPRMDLVMVEICKMLNTFV